MSLSYFKMARFLGAFLHLSVSTTSLGKVELWETNHWSTQKPLRTSIQNSTPPWRRRL